MIISSILQLVLHENELGLTAPSGLLRLIPSHRGIEGDWKALLRASLEARNPAGNPAFSPGLEDPRKLAAGSISLLLGNPRDGVAWPYPRIFPGASAPYLWRPGGASPSRVASRREVPLLRVPGAAAAAPSSSSALPVELPRAKQPPTAAGRSYALPCLLSSDPPPHRRCQELPHLAGSAPARARQAGGPPPPLRRRPHRATRTSPELTHLVRDEPGGPPLRRRTSPSSEIQTPRTDTVWSV